MWILNTLIYGSPKCNERSKKPRSIIEKKLMNLPINIFLFSHPSLGLLMHTSEKHLRHVRHLDPPCPLKPVLDILKTQASLFMKPEFPCCWKSLSVLSIIVNTCLVHAVFPHMYSLILKCSSFVSTTSYQVEITTTVKNML